MMKAKLLFSEQRLNIMCALFIVCLYSNFGWSQELVENGTCDDHSTGSDSSNTIDNVDVWDMTPNSELNDGIVSPHRFDATNNPDGWRNDDLESAIEIKYLGTEGSIDEQAESTSKDNEDIRGVKLYDDGNIAITNNLRIEVSDSNAIITKRIIIE